MIPDEYEYKQQEMDEFDMFEEIPDELDVQNQPSTNEDFERDFENPVEDIKPKKINSSQLPSKLPTISSKCEMSSENLLLNTEG